MELKIKSLYASLLLTGIIFSVSAQAEVYRWLDENGEVHYSETLPPHLKDQTHDVLNERGIVLDEDMSLAPEAVPEELPEEVPQDLPRDASGMSRQKAKYSESEMQQRMDNFLMLRYDSEEEIVEAMNVEIKQLSYDRRLMNTTQHSMNDAYRGQLKLAAEKQRAGQQVSEEIIRQIRDLQSKLAENSLSLNGLQKREDEIKIEFQKQLDRYRYLADKYAEESSGP